MPDALSSPLARQIDAEPSDFALRLVFADWLEEQQGELFGASFVQHAAGQRWLVEGEKVPLKWPEGWMWWQWQSIAKSRSIHECHTLPFEVPESTHHVRRPNDTWVAQHARPALALLHASAEWSKPDAQSALSAARQGEGR